jgi:hypothetical protein
VRMATMVMAPRCTEVNCKASSSVYIVLYMPSRIGSTALQL